MKNSVSFKSLVNMMDNIDMLVVIEVFDAESLFDPGDTGFGNRNPMMLFVDDIVFVRLENFDIKPHSQSA